MTSDPSSSPEGSKPLPKATVPVELAPPAESAGIVRPAEPPPESATRAPEAGDAPGVPTAAALTGSVASISRTLRISGWLRSLSMVEKLCCAAIVVGVFVFAAVVFIPALYDFPDEPQLLEASDFPVQGSQVRVESAETYWREPTAEDENADKVREDTAFLPVFDAKLSGQGRVLLLFRDAEGQIAGDLLSLELSGEANHAVAGTAGFMRHGDFAAYRAGEVESWIVEFHEVPEGTEEISDKTELFKMKISPILK